MASLSCIKIKVKLITLILLAILLVYSSAQLSTDYYSKSCPEVFETIKSSVRCVVSKETRMAASLLRLFFHDCFVNVYISLAHHLLSCNYLELLQVYITSIN